MQIENMVETDDIQRELTSNDRSLPILRGISFSVMSGEWVALTGPSGSGKSTLLGILAGIDRPTSGSVRVAGFEITNQTEGQLAHFRNEMIGIVFQSFNLISTMTALENVEAPMYIHPNRRDARDQSMDMLRQVGLSDRLHHLPHQLSGGEQQRVAIARALVTRPQVLLADEPTGNLDSSTSKQVMQIIEEMHSRLKLTIIIVTHDASIAARADRCLHMMDGKLASPEPVQPPPLYFKKASA